MQNVQNPPILIVDIPKDVHLFIASFCIFGWLLWDSTGVFLFISEPEMIVGNQAGLDLVTFPCDLVTFFFNLVSAAYDRMLSNMVLMYLEANAPPQEMTRHYW